MCYMCSGVWGLALRVLEFRVSWRRVFWIQGLGFRVLDQRRGDSTCLKCLSCCLALFGVRVGGHVLTGEVRCKLHCTRTNVKPKENVTIPFLSERLNSCEL